MSRNIKIKVCGMKFPNNIRELLTLQPDYIGFVFYPSSSRYFEGDLSGISFGNTKKTGVFVNENPEKIFQLAKNHRLDAIQLHGNESPAICKEIQSKGYEVIKAFSIDENFNFSHCSYYSEFVDLFLFDTKGKLPGGNGKHFNWKKLDEYHLQKKFLLSGGIGLKDLEAIRNFHHKYLYGIDVNSGFEVNPGEKNIEDLKIFINHINKL